MYDSRLRRRSQIPLLKPWDFARDSALMYSFIIHSPGLPTPVCPPYWPLPFCKVSCVSSHLYNKHGCSLPSAVSRNVLLMLFFPPILFSLCWGKLLTF